MSLDPHVQRLLSILAVGGRASMADASIAQRRAGLADLMKLGGPAPAVGRTDDRMLPGPACALRVRVYTPLDGAMAPESPPPAHVLLPGLIYFHGGGLVAGSIDTHDCIARALANAGGCRVVAVDYRLAPEHPFPAALDDALAAVRHVTSHAQAFGIDRHRLGLCGDSAGATLAAATCHALARADDRSVALQLLLCPILDYAKTASPREGGSHHLVDQATLAHDLAHYLPAGIDPVDPRVSPLYAVPVNGMPPTIVHTAEYDLVRDDGARYVERLTATGSAARHQCHPGMIHLFYGLAGVIPYAHAAFQRIGQDIRAALA